MPAVYRSRTSRFLVRSAVTLSVLSSTLIWNPLSQYASAACSALPTDKGTDTMAVTAPTTATYRVWSRIMAPDTTNNTFLMQVDQTYCNISVGGGTAIPANTWTWVNYQNGSTTSTVDMNLTGGSHTVTLAGSGVGVKVDRLILTTDTSCVPTGTGDNCATSPATITLTGVTAGQTVSGGVPIGATLTGATGVTKVDFYIDNTLNSTDATAPYCMGGDNGSACNSVDTIQIANGSHTFKAIATYSGGTLTASAAATVSNTNPSQKVGDINNDGSVNIFDLSILLSKWGTTDAASDLNKDGSVNVFDLSILLSHWGT
jgi:hypothetical protein